jgi:hypothetical protein
MKTKISSLIGLFTVIITLATGLVRAQDPTPAPKIAILPIQSPDATRELALGIVDHGTRSVWAASIDWNWEKTKTWTSATGKGAEAVLDQLLGTELVYRLTNPEDVITGYIWLYDKNNNLIFFGSAQYVSSQLAKGYKPLYGVWIQEVPILEDVLWGEVLALDEDGKTGNRQSLRVNDLGQLMWRPYLSGSPNGVLVAAFKNGNTSTYNLWNPVAETPYAVFDDGGYKIPGHYVVNGGICPVGFTCTSTLKIVELYERPTVLFRAPTDQQVSLDVMGVVYENGFTTFERPYAVDVTYDSGESKTLKLDVNAPSTIALLKGEPRLKFHWVKFALPYTLYAGPIDGGGIGKGKAEATTPVTP